MLGLSKRAMATPVTVPFFRHAAIDVPQFEQNKRSSSVEDG